MSIVGFVANAELEKAEVGSYDYMKLKIEILC